MNRRILCLLLTLVVLFIAFIPFAKADEVKMFASDGRTINVESADIPLWINVGWFESPEDARIITMYSSDGRTIEIPQYYREAYRNVYWFDTPEDARLITMYSMDGRTISVPQYYREAYRNVGWYNTLAEVTIKMYSTDGRTLEVFKDAAEAHHKVGWYYNLSDVTVTMYDQNGVEHTVFKDHIARETAKGWSLTKSSSTQLMFSSDGRFIQVPHNQVAAYENVGWYRAGGKIDPTRPMVAITFDDGPGKYTNDVLSILEKYNVHATFFVQGKSVASYASVLQRAVSLGCEIGNHTWSHVDLSKSSASNIANQINSTNTAVYNATGVYPKLYRPPYGAYNKTVLNSIAMPAIMWSVDTLDWKTRNAAKTLESVRKSTKDGGIILMHDIHKPTLDAVESVVKHLLMNNFQLVTVSELIQTRQGSAVSGRTYNSVNP